MECRTLAGRDVTLGCHGVRQAHSIERSGALCQSGRGKTLSWALSSSIESSGSESTASSLTDRITRPSGPSIRPYFGRPLPVRKRARAQPTKAVMMAPAAISRRWSHGTQMLTTSQNVTPAVPGIHGFAERTSTSTRRSAWIWSARLWRSSADGSLGPWGAIRTVSNNAPFLGCRR